MARNEHDPSHHSLRRSELSRGKRAKNFIHDATKVLFVRHPFNRLASAYYDKIATLRIPSVQDARNIHVSLYGDIRRAICRKFAQQYLSISELTFYQQQQTNSKE
ncbi:unnamed protein product [Didymodactylos carnosus]|uniref:Sulfotransferase n=1 Tax=Didymodactylos carnosus TaxID=1234261 RepID=A0A814I8Y3_9BILA|nr:unnamed protein product [Didymodactylos carnosus]CAF1165380.1 unnamed protein product [Didymodactylos carnosus]CAF3792149.1 unnamed protein product [Didymodactylos carnosus]CAF3977079.1 unnamed protein product [Didymodactylos carnosus]